MNHSVGLAGLDRPEHHGSASCGKRACLLPQHAGSHEAAGVGRQIVLTNSLNNVKQWKSGSST